MSLCQSSGLFNSIIPTIGLLFLLVAIALFLLSRFIKSRQPILGKAAGYSAIMALLLFVLAIIFPVVWGPLLVHVVPAPYGQFCGPGTEAVMLDMCGLEYECVPFDPLGGQLCASSNYTLCKFGCACSTDGGGVGQCLRYTVAITERLTCSCPTHLFNETGCISAYQTVSCCLV